MSGLEHVHVCPVCLASPAVGGYRVHPTEAVTWVCKYLSSNGNRKIQLYFSSLDLQRLWDSSSISISISPPRTWVFRNVSDEEMCLENIQERARELAKDNPIYQVDSLASEVAAGTRKVVDFNMLLCLYPTEVCRVTWLLMMRPLHSGYALLPSSGMIGLDGSVDRI